MLIFTLYAVTVNSLVVEDDQEESLNEHLDDLESFSGSCRSNSLEMQNSQTSEKNIWRIDDPKSITDWMEAIHDDDGALARKALDYADEKNPTEGFRLYTDITELKSGSFSKRVWKSSANSQSLYVVKLWKKEAMSAFNRTRLETNHHLSDMKKVSFLATAHKAFQRLSFLMDHQQALMDAPIRILIPCALIVVGHGEDAEFIEISECSTGKSLEEMIKIHSHDSDFLVKLFFKAGQKLALLHQDRHIVHGDLSPGNMFFNEETQVFSWIDTQSVCLLGEGNHNHQYEEEVRTMIGYLMRGYNDEIADKRKGATKNPARAQALKRFEGGFSIPDSLKKQLAEAFIDGYVANLKEDTSPIFKKNLQHMHSNLSRRASPSGLTEEDSDTV